jgi:hypothetical protein
MFIYSNCGDVRRIVDSGKLFYDTARKKKRKDVCDKALPLEKHEEKHFFTLDLSITPSTLPLN